MKTLKVVGISGVGKTTLLALFIRKNPDCSALSYGEYLARYGDEADKHWNADLVLTQGLAVIGDHLEWGDTDFVATYKAEKTCGILLLTVTPHKLLERRKRDATRKRSLDMNAIIVEQSLTKRRARYVADELSIPLRSLHDTTMRESYRALRALVQEVG
ncbi:MAG: hypothetical protein HYT29_01350 [Parcubacteria group bacterium]|nr:hypothetical protein [Parcubacteria group bacterium]